MYSETVKSNTVGKLFSPTQALLAIVNNVRSTYQHPATTLAVLGTVIARSFLGRDIRHVRDAFGLKCSELRCAGNDWYTKAIDAVAVQATLATDAAANRYCSVLDVIHAELVAVDVVGDTMASTKLRVLASILEISEVSADRVTGFVQVIETKADLLGISGKSWITGPITALKAQVTTGSDDVDEKTPAIATTFGEAKPMTDGVTAPPTSEMLATPASTANGAVAKPVSTNEQRAA